MNKEEELFLAIGDKMKDVIKSQMFGKPCLKINGKAFACFFQQSMVFKLSGEKHKEALKLSGSKLFDPSGKKRPMKEWVQVPFQHSSNWETYAKASYKYVNEL